MPGGNKDNITPGRPMDRYMFRGRGSDHQQEAKTSKSASPDIDTTRSARFDELMAAIIRLEQRVSDSEEKILAQLNDQARHFNEKISELEQSLQHAHARIDDFQKENASLKSRLKELSCQTGNLQQEVSLLKKDSLSSQRHSREFNIRVNNVQEEAGENCRDKLVQFVLDNNIIPEATKEKIDSMFENVHRTGKKISGKPKQIIGRCYSRETKRTLVAGGKRKGPNGENLVHEDFATQDYQARKKSLPVMKRFYEEGKRCKFVKGNLYVDGKLVSVDEVTV